jgi:hypothetical protein
MIHSRPSKRDRETFSSLVPHNQIRRTGPNKATEITFCKDVMIDHQLFQTGRYSIYKIPGKNQWSFILNSTTAPSGTRYNLKNHCVHNSISTRNRVFLHKFCETKKEGLLYFWDGVKHS